MKPPTFELPRDPKRVPVVAALIETFGWTPLAASVGAVALLLMIAAATVWVIRTNPPRTIVLTSGPAGSTYQRWAEAYRDAMAEHGVTLEIRPSAGSTENFWRLRSIDSDVDIGFLSSGIATTPHQVEGLVSLGSISNQPLFVFYRAAVPLTRLAELAGKRIAIGPPRSGTRTLALTLLQANGIAGPPTTFVELDSEAAGQALLDGKLDAIFVMGESTPVQTLRTLARSSDVRMFNFAQADAYLRRFPYLTRFGLPEGSIDFARNLPAESVTLIGPTIELVARDGFNPALSDLILEVAKGVHGRATILQRKGEFPAPIEHEIPLSDDALRYYKSGKGFLYTKLNSFWLASLINRLLVAVVPLALVVIPAIRLLPTAYRFRIQLRFYRLYRPLLRIEHEAFGGVKPDRAKELTEELEELHRNVNHLRVPASFASQYYDLRNHIAFVRERLRIAAAA